MQKIKPHQLDIIYEAIDNFVTWYSETLSPNSEHVNTSGSETTSGKIYIYSWAFTLSVCASHNDDAKGNMGFTDVTLSDDDDDDAKVEGETLVT